MSTSDDYPDVVFDAALWRKMGPAGIAAGVATDAIDANIELVTQDEASDAFQVNSLARAVQDAVDGDLRIIARFLTRPIESFQLQDILVEQDAANWARIDADSTDDIIDVIVRYVGGESATTTVTFECESGQDRGPDYAIDWSNVTDIRNVAQSVDGEPTPTGNGVCPAGLRHNRRMSLDDGTWDFFEVQLALLPCDLSAVRGLHDFALWLNGYAPEGFLFHSAHNVAPQSKVRRNVPDTRYALAQDIRLNSDIRIEQSGIYDRICSLRVWEDVTAEPVDCRMEVSPTRHETTTGSFGLVTRQDVELHEVHVDEIEVRQMIRGGITEEVLRAETGSDSTPGTLEFDAFVGSRGIAAEFRLTENTPGFLAERHCGFQVATPTQFQQNWE